MNAREFERYYRRFYVPLCMYALRLVEETTASEDMVQDAFIKTWRYCENGGVIDSFPSFIYRTVRNECLLFLRGKKTMLGEEYIPEVSETDIDTSERDARIWSAIGALPEKCRKVFLMSKQKGMSNEAIAEEMGISVKTVKNQMTKALGRLREELKEGNKPFFLPFL
ncbi:MAG: RNA polymerase sigma-70 factor [Muribaculaceae bacterium]|nr:RNA polymerase sigma-70 factor [Muribaculaceae bacterium]